MSVKTDKVQVSVVVDGKQGISELGKLEMEANDLRHTMQGLKRDSAEYAAEAEKYKQVKAKMGELREEIGLSGLTMKQLRQYARELQTELDTTATRGTARYAELKDKIQDVNGAIAKQRAEVAGTSSMWSKISTEVKQFGMLAVGALGLQFLSDQVTNLIQKGAKLSDELSDIRKTTGMTTREVQEFSSELGKIDTRTSSSELRKIAAGAGQLGIAKKDILDFTDATDKLVVSLGDEFQGGAEEVTKQMGALRNIFSDVKSDDVASDMLHIGNAINELGASGAATGPVVADFANRIGGVGITMGLTSGQVLGLSATLQELNVSTERGGTATVKILQAMAGEPAKFAKVAGMEVSKFTDLVNTDLYGALVKVSEGVSKNGSSATELAKILENLGVDGAGASEVMAKLGNNTALLHEKVQLASKSLGSTTSIMTEFATKNDNLAGKIEKLTKQLSGAFTNSAFNDWVEGMVDGLLVLTTTVDETEKEVDALTASALQQQDSFQKLEKDATPLIERYDELKGKTSLNKAEQEELRKVIDQLATVLPTAVTEWDKYGKAMDINAEAAKGFLKQQKSLLEQENAPIIAQTQAFIDKLTKQREELRVEMNRKDETGTYTIKRVMVKGGMDDQLRMEEQRATIQDIERWNAYYDKLGDIISGQELKLAQLRGEKTKEQIAAEEAAKKKLTGVATETLGILAQIDQKIKDLHEQQYKVTQAKGQAAAAKEIQRIGREIKEQEELKKKLLGEADEKELERARKAAEKKAKAEHDAALRGLLALQELVRKERAKLDGMDEDADQQELNRIKEHYDELIRKAKLMARDQHLTTAERHKAEELAEELWQQRAEALANKQIEQMKKHAADQLKVDNQLALDRANLRILLAKRHEDTNPEELKNALIAKVELERDILLQNANLTKEQRVLIEKQAEDEINAIRSKSNDKQNKLLDEQKKKLLRTIEQFHQAMTQLMTSFNTIMRAQDEQQLRRIERAKDGRLAQLEKEKEAGTISLQEYENQKAAITEEADRKARIIQREQAERERAVAAFQIMVDTTVAIAKTYAQLGAPAAIPVAAFVGAMGVVQLATLMATPMPEFRAGGYTANGFTGLEHQNLSRGRGGMLPGGPFLATVNEAGPEYFVPHHLLRQPQVAQSVALIEAIRTGSPGPGFVTSGPGFVAGGYSDAPAVPADAPASSTLDQATALRLSAAIEQLSNTLSRPLYAQVVYQELADAGDTLNQLKQLNSY